MLEGLLKCTTRSVLIALSTAFWLSTIILWVVAGAVVVSYGHFSHFSDTKFTLIPAILLVVAGFVFFFAGILSCYAGYRANQCILGTLVFLLFVIVIALAVAAVMSVVYQDKIKTSVTDRANQVLHKYEGGNSSDPFTTQMDYLQRVGKCCGVKNYTDWFGTEWEKKYNESSVPWSCAANHSSSAFQKHNPISLMSGGEEINEDGCVHKAMAQALNKLHWIVGSSLAFFTIMIVGMLSACILAKILRNEELPYFNLGA